MKTVLTQVFLLTTLSVLLAPNRTEAGGMIITPGKPAKMVSSFGDGYAIYDMGGGGTTYVQHMDSQSTMIRRSGEPTTFIYNNPGTEIEPVLPIGPDLTGEIEGFE